METIYFASDFHLGIDARQTSREREQLLVKWLNEEVKPHATQLFLVGDLFDFWYEYKRVVPRGFTRFLGTLGQLADEGIQIHIFTGNHDLWMRDYLNQELGATLYREPQIFEWDGKTFLIGHGDGLGPGDKGYKRLKKLFTNRQAQWLFSRLHPNFAIAMANFWSGTSRKYAHPDERTFLGPEKEWLIQYCERKLTSRPDIDHFIFGHRHLPIDYTLSNNRSRYLNLGDWLEYQSYAKWDGSSLRLEFYERDLQPYTNQSDSI